MKVLFLAAGLLLASSTAFAAPDAAQTAAICGQRTSCKVEKTYEYALINGVTVVYAQAEAGKQARLLSTAGFAGNRPIYIPDTLTLAGRPSTSDRGLCHVQNGRLVAIE